jgi:O-antigen/teichoic acid export membrane protein
MKDRLASTVGTALFWKAIQLGGVKSIFLIRLLILARMLSPDDFGLLAIAVTAIGFLLSVTDLGMIPALVQREEINDQYYNAAWTVGLIRALVISLAVFLAAPLIANIFAEPRATVILQVLAIRPLLDAAASTKLASLIRNLEFRSLAFVKLSEALLNTIVAISLATMLGVWALVAGALAGSAAYMAFSYMLAPHRPALFLNYARVKHLITFGRWIFLTGLIAVSGASILKVVISRQLGAVELGLYFLAAKLAFLPAELAGEVSGSVAFPLYARLQSDIHKATQAFRGMLTGLTALLMPVCALIIVLAPSLVENILGPRWDGTLPVIQILAMVSFIGLFGETIVPILKGLGQPYKVALLEAVQSLLLITFGLGLAGHYGIAGVALAWVPAVATSQCISFVFARQILYKPFKDLKLPMIAIASASLIGAAAAWGLDSQLDGIFGLTAAVLMATVLIVTVLWSSDRRFTLGLANALAQVFPFLGNIPGFSSARE